MGTVAELLALADSQVGQTSGERYWDAYARRHNGAIGAYVSGDATPYCAAFDTWLLDETGTECAHFPSLVAFDWSDVGSRGIGKYDLRAGDMVSFDWDGDSGGDHVGVVREVHGWGVVTVEGNTSGGVVARRNRYWDSIICGVRPAYSEEDEMTEADFQRIQRMLDAQAKGLPLKVWSYKNPSVNGDRDAYWLLTNQPMRVWGYRNGKYESVDAYRILRDVRDALFPTAAKAKDGYEAKGGVLARVEAVLAKVASALGVRQ